MIIKLSGCTPAHLEQLEKFFNSRNWVSYPTGTQFYYGGEPPSTKDTHEVEHVFARLIRKTRDKDKPELKVYNITLEINPFIFDLGGCEVKVPLRYLAELMQALDLFSEDYEHTNTDLL